MLAKLISYVIFVIIVVIALTIDTIVYVDTLYTRLKEWFKCRKH